MAIVTSWFARKKLRSRKAQDMTFSVPFIHRGHDPKNPCRDVVTVNCPQKNIMMTFIQDSVGKSGLTLGSRTCWEFASMAVDDFGLRKSRFQRFVKCPRGFEVK